MALLAAMRVARLLSALLAVGVLTGCSPESGEGGNSPSLSSSTTCSQWLHEPISAREGFIHSYWYELSEPHIKKVIEIKDASCRGAGGTAVPGHEPTVGPFEPLVKEVISCTYW